jgi:hypothetical protein
LLVGLGQNFDDLPPLSSENNPVEVGVDENQAGASVTSKSHSITIFSSVSFREFNHYIEYVPRPVPQSLIEYFFSFSNGSVIELLEGEYEEDGSALATRW